MSLFRSRLASLVVVAWLGLVSCLVVVPAQAQVQLQKPANVWGPYSHWFPKGQTGWEVASKPATAAASGASGSGGAVVVNKAGTAVLTQPRLPSINVPVNVATKVPGAAAAAAAARAATVARAAMGPLGAAWLTWQIYNEVKDSGVTVCPPPDFFCKPNVIDYDRDQPGWFLSSGGTRNWTINEYIASRLSATESFRDKYEFHSLDTTPWPDGRPAVEVILINTNTKVLSRQTKLIYNQGSVNKTERQGDPLSDAEVEKAMIDRIKADSTGARAKKAYDAAMAADALMREAGKEGVPQSVMQPTGSQSTLTTPPVTTPDAVIGTKQIIDAQGNPQTVTNTATTTVTPVVSGSGHETSITYNITYNTTNSTTTGPDTPPKVEKETIIIRIEPEAVPPQDLEIPTDYNREVTQKSILEVLREFASPITEAIPTGETETGSIKAANDEALQVATGIDAGSLGLTSWFPDIPTAQCVNPQVKTPITGDMVTVPICDAVNVFSRIVSGVLCFFCIVGCVAQVRAAQQA